MLPIRTGGKLLLGLTIAVLAGLVCAVPVAAQLANASARSLGLVGNDTASVRGFGAISVNPAGLAMPGSDFSLTVATVRVAGGAGPITLAELKEYEGKLIDRATKLDWLEKVEADDRGQHVAAAVEVTEAAVTFWNLGIQLSTSAHLTAQLPNDVVEALLFGNAGRDGQAKDLVLTAGELEGYALTTAGLGFALELPGVEDWGIGADHMAVGVTVKYSLGHALAVGRTFGSVRSDPLAAEVEAWLVHTEIEESDFDDLLHVGGGVGLDLGVMLTLDRLALGASVQNLLNSFAWDPARLTAQHVTASFDVSEEFDRIRSGSNAADDDSGPSFELEEKPYEEAPENMRTMVEELRIAPSVRIGAAYDLSDLLMVPLTISSDFHYRFGGMVLTPQFHAGIGAEYQVVEWFHLRSGLAFVTGDIQYGGGLSFVLGPVDLSLAVLGRQLSGLLAHVTLSFGSW